MLEDDDPDDAPCWRCGGLILDEPEAIE